MGVMPSPATGKKPNSISLALARGEELKKDMNLYEPCSVTIHSSVLRFIRTIPAALVLLLLYTGANNVLLFFRRAAACSWRRGEDGDIRYLRVPRRLGNG
jgi:hypothetical protein